MEPKNTPTPDPQWLEQALPIGDSAGHLDRRHCFLSIAARMATSPKPADRIVAQNERLKHEVEPLREEPTAPWWGKG